MNYWELVTYENERISVKPENVQLVQAKLATAEGFITTPTRSIAVKSIKDFVESDKPYTDQKVIEDGARAFGTPMLNPDGSVIVRWVKKSVTRREFGKYYSAHQAYRKISESDNHVMITWKQPVHLIDSQLVSELTQDEERNLSKKI
jgi:hypothetical protein